MEPNPDIRVKSPRRLKDCEAHQKRARIALAERERIADLVRRAIHGMKTEAIRKAIGDTVGNVGNTRRDVGTIRSTRPERIHGISLDRMLVFCEGLNVDPYGNGAAARVH